MPTSSRRTPAPAPARATRPAKRPASASTKARHAPDVVRFLAELRHPAKPEIEAVRALILGADPAIQEAVKWNAPSFRTTEFFATFNLRVKKGVQLVLHRGAKNRSDDA